MNTENETTENEQPVRRRNRRAQAAEVTEVTESELEEIPVEPVPAEEPSEPQNQDNVDTMPPPTSRSLLSRAADMERAFEKLTVSEAQAAANAANRVAMRYIEKRNSLIAADPDAYCLMTATLTRGPQS
jgi:hypothetical protein